MSRSKGNQTIKFGQLIEYNIRNIYLKNYTQNVVEKVLLDPFLFKKNRIPLDQLSINFCFYCMPS